MKTETFDADRMPVYENPTRVKDPRRYIRLCLDQDVEKSRNLTRFVKKLLLASISLFLLALLVGAAIS